MRRFARLCERDDDFFLAALRGNGNRNALEGLLLARGAPDGERQFLGAGLQRFGNDDELAVAVCRGGTRRLAGRRERHNRTWRRTTSDDGFARWLDADNIEGRSGR